MNHNEQSQYEQRMSAIPEQGTIMRAGMQADMQADMRVGLLSG